MALRNVDRASDLNAGLLRRFSGAHPDRPVAADGAAGGAAARPEDGTTDSLELSGAAQRLARLEGDLAAAREGLARLPDVRAERVAAAREKLAAGAYGEPEVRQSTAARLGAVLRRLENLFD